MAEKTGIAWTDHTHNEWWGCSSTAGAGCDHCYAATLDRRTGGHFFGTGTTPRMTGIKNRNKPLRWAPTMPEGEGWILVGKSDSDGGPWALFVRRKP